MRRAGPSITARNAVSSGREVMTTGRPLAASAGELATLMPCSRASARRAPLWSAGGARAFDALSARVGEPRLALVEGSHGVARLDDELRHRQAHLADSDEG